jgi:AraC-like DNA-binding protein
MAARKADPPRGILDPAGHRAKISLDRYEPSAPLADLVEHYWVVAWELADGEIYRSENLPYPSVHLVFEQARSYVQGVHTGVFVHRARGSGRVFAVKFRPGGFFPFFNAPVSRLTNRRLDVGSVFGAAGRRLGAAIAGQAGVDDRIRLAEELLLALRPAPDRRRALVAGVIEHIASGGVWTVAALEERFGMSARALQALFNRYVGVGPKWVIRRFRIHEALERLHAEGSIDTGSLALDLGYTDQAHFINDFKAMTGRTPAGSGRAAGAAAVRRGAG